MISFGIRPIIAEFIQFLNEKQLTDVECKINYMNGYDCMEGEDGQKGWAAYVSSEKIMYIPGEFTPPDGEDWPQDEIDSVVLTCVAHEYIHHVQNAEERPFDEEEADNRAVELVMEFARRGTADD